MGKIAFTSRVRWGESAWQGSHGTRSDVRLVLTLMTRAYCFSAAPCPDMPAPCPEMPKELRSAQALMHGAESALTQGLDKRSLVMVLLVSLVLFI